MTWLYRLHRLVGIYREHFVGSATYRWGRAKHFVPGSQSKISISERQFVKFRHLVIISLQPDGLIERLSMDKVYSYWPAKYPQSGRLTDLVTTFDQVHLFELFAI